MYKFFAAAIDFLSKPSLLRLKGYRTEVIVFLLRKYKGEFQVLLGMSTYDNWMPPQEGVNLNESFEDAAYRCLSTECSIDMEKLVKRNSIYIRSIRYLDTLELIDGRKGERPVVDSANNNLYGFIKLKGKAYWIASTILAEGDNNAADVAPNGLELTEIKWFNCDEALIAIQKTNRKEKASMLAKGLSMIIEDLHG